MENAQDTMKAALAEEVRSANDGLLKILRPMLDGIAHLQTWSGFFKSDIINEGTGRVQIGIPSLTRGAPALHEVARSALCCGVAPALHEVAPALCCEVATDPDEVSTKDEKEKETAKKVLLRKDEGMALFQYTGTYKTGKAWTVKLQEEIQPTSSDSDNSWSHRAFEGDGIIWPGMGDDDGDDKLVFRFELCRVDDDLIRGTYGISEDDGGISSERGERDRGTFELSIPKDDGQCCLL